MGVVINENSGSQGMAVHKTDTGYNLRMGIKKMPLAVLMLFLAGCSVSPTTSMQEFNWTETPAFTEEVQVTELSNPTSEPTSSPLPACLLGQAGTPAEVLEVIDGDTILVNINGVHAKVRYLGMDTPEMTASDPKPGELAKAANESLVSGKQVMLYKGKRDRDEYGRLLRFVIADGDFVNLTLVQRGNAVSFNRPHDALCAQELDSQMYAAFNSGLGIWPQINDSYQPAAEVEAVCPEGCTKHVDGCDIKGNISQEGDYIFHVPGSRDYDSVKIYSSQGERWFCTIGEAVKNGFRPPRAE